MSKSVFKDQNSSGIILIVLTSLPCLFQYAKFGPNIGDGLFWCIGPKLTLLMPGGTQGPNIFPPLLAVVCCLPRFCPCVPSLSVSVLLYSVTPASFGSAASASLPVWLSSKGNGAVAVHFFSQDMSNSAPSPPSNLLTYLICHGILKQSFLSENVTRLTFDKLIIFKRGSCTCSTIKMVMG